MAEWPDLAELKQTLDVTSEDWDGDDDGTRLTAVLSSAIDVVKDDVGAWDDETDEPTDRQARAALRMAELIALRPDASAEHSNDPTYLRLLKGSRRKFGVA